MAIKIWRGDAQGVAQVDIVEFENIEPHDTFTLTCNRKDITVESDEDDELTDAGDATQANLLDALIAAFVTAIGQFSNAVPEWAEVSASAVTDSVTGLRTSLKLTGLPDGTPFTVAGSTADAGNFGVSVATLVAGDPGQNEKQRITLGGTPTGGTFTLTFAGQTTGAIAYNASAATVETALEALSNIASGDVAVTGADGGPWTVEFLQAYAGVNVPLMTGSGASITGACSISVATTVDGEPSTDEVQVIDASELSASETFKIFFSNPSGISDVSVTISGSSTTGFIQGVVDSMGSIGPGNCIVTLDSAKVWRFTFTGTLAGQNLNLMSIGAVSGTAPTVTEETAGSATGTDETQVVTVVGGPTGGTFTLTFEGQTTGTIAYNADAATVKAALEALSNITTVTVTGDAGGPYTVEFNDPGAVDVQQMTGSGTSLTGASVATVTTQSATVATNEQQQVSLDGNPVGGTFTLTIDLGSGDETTGNLDFDATAAEVETELEGLTSATSGDFSVSGSDGGPWIVEFTGNFAATNTNAMEGDGSSLTGSGTQGITITPTVTPTGPNWFSEAENWQTVGSSTAAAPTGTDTIVFEKSSVPCKFGLDALPTITPAEIHAKASFAANIGLPSYNEAGYYEYRPTSLKLKPTLVVVGEGSGPGSSLLRFDFNSTQVTLNVYGTGTPSSDEQALIFKGSAAGSVVNVYRGSVGIATENHEDVAIVEDLFVGYVSSVDSDASVVIGSGVVDLDDVTQAGGSVVVYSDSSLTVETWIKSGGSLDFDGAGGVTLLRNLEGRVDWNSSGTAAAVEIGSGAEVYATRDSAGTFTDCELQAGATLVAPKTLTFTNPIVLDNCSLQEVVLDLGSDITLAPG